MKIKIHPLFFLLFLLAYLIGEVKTTSLFFIAIFIHDFAHFIVAKYYGVNIKEIKFLPLGCQMKMDDDYLEDNQKIVIYFVGPLVNIIFSVFLYVLKINGWYIDLYNEILFSHICIGLINLLPFHPMDGSVIIKILLSNFVGYIRASKIVISFTILTGVGLIALTLYSIWNHLYNINFGLIGLFFLFQSYKESQYIDAKGMKSDLMKRNKVIAKDQSVRCERICTNKDTKLKKIMINFKPKSYYLVEVLDSNYNYITTLTEEDILNGIINLGYDCTIRDILIK